MTFLPYDGFSLLERSKTCRETKQKKTPYYTDV